VLRRLQDSPHSLEIIYDLTLRLLRPFRRWLTPKSRLERLFVWLERWSKGALFDCRMCGQCVLHDTGMTCPMTCPKNLRNGPCGGVRLNGNCEIKPDMPCVWVQAWERSKRMPVYGGEILHIQVPVNHSLKDTSAWINDFHQAEKLTLAGWEE
jgi:hypothetical protein